MSQTTVQEFNPKRRRTALDELLYHTETVQKAIASYAETMRSDAATRKAKAQEETREAEKWKTKAQEEAKEAEKWKVKAQEEAKEAEKWKAKAQEETREAEKWKAKAQEEAKEAEKWKAKAQEEARGTRLDIAQQDDAVSAITSVTLTSLKAKLYECTDGTYAAVQSHCPKFQLDILSQDGIVIKDPTLVGRLVCGGRCNQLQYAVTVMCVATDGALTPCESSTLYLKHKRAGVGNHLVVFCNELNRIVFNSRIVSPRETMLCVRVELHAGHPEDLQRVRMMNVAPVYSTVFSPRTKVPANAFPTRMLVPGP